MQLLFIPIYLLAAILGSQFLGTHLPLIPACILAAIWTTLMFILICLTAARLLKRRERGL